MIVGLSGKIISNTGSAVAVQTAGGVVYQVAISPAGAQRWKVGAEVDILTYLVVRENALELYGFAEEKDRTLFLHLLAVSGIGPKTALHILSLGSSEEIASAIGHGDIDYLTRVSGIGKKTAERVVVELKSKVQNLSSAITSSGVGGVIGDVVEGLVALGYPIAMAREVVNKLDPAGKTSEQLLREALRMV